MNWGMAKRSIRDLLRGKRADKPELNPEMRSLILSFDAHLQQRRPQDSSPQPADPRDVDTDSAAPDSRKAL